MALFPGALPAAGSASASATLAAAGHTSLHNTHSDELRALGTKMGTGASTPTSGTVLRGTGAGTSAWGQVVLTTDVTGVLPVANGGTGTTTSTGTGATVLSNSPTIVTPTIASFANATHDHSNAAGGGSLGSDAVSTNNIQNSAVTTAKIADDAVTTAKVVASGCDLTHSVSQSIANTTLQALVFDTEAHDTASYHSTSSNTSRITVPTAGTYLFLANASFDVNATGVRFIWFVKNGASTQRIGLAYAPATTGETPGLHSATVLKLSATDYVEAYVYQNSGGALNVLGDDAAFGRTKFSCVRLGS